MDSTLSGVHLIIANENKIYTINSNFKLIKSPKIAFSHVFFSDKKDTIINNLVQKVVTQTGKNLLATTYFYKKDSLKIQMPQMVKIENAALQFYFKYEVFPLKIRIGAPKTLLSYTAISKLHFNSSINLYHTLLLKYKSKRQRKKVMRALQMIFVEQN